MKIKFIFSLFFIYLNTVAQNDSLNKKSIEKLINNASKNYAEGQYELSLQNSREALLKSFKIDDDYLIAHSYNSIGVVYNEFSNSKRAINYYQKALYYSKNLNDLQLKNWINGNLGSVYYYDLHNAKKGIEFYKKALDFAAQLNDSIQIQYTKLNIAAAYFSVNDFKSGKKFLDDISKKIETQQIDDAKIQLYDLLGTYYQNDIKDFETSNKYFQKALILALKTNSNFNLINIYGNLTNLFKLKNDFSAASVYESKKIALEKETINDEKLAKLENDAFQSDLDINNIKLEKIEILYEKQQLQAKDSKIIYGLFSAVILVFLGFIVMLYFNNRNKKLSNALLTKTNEELRLMKDIAEENANLKSQFISTISHELRTPLNGIVGITNLITNQKPINNANIEHLNALKFSAKYLLGLVNNILQVSKIEEGKMSLNNDTFSLKDLLETVKNSLHYLQEKNNNSLEVKIDPIIPKFIVGDAIRLSQIFMNLASNALKFTNNGNVKVQATSKSLELNNVTVLFEVLDNGIGIPLDYQKVIFDKFVQIKQKNADYQGTGLGLTIVKNLIELFESDISVESIPEVQTRFWFEINFGINKSIKKITNDPKEIEIKSKLKILIVEDNKINQMLTAKIIENAGHQCQYVACGFDAINLIKKETFDCILMDLNMPDIDGFETSKRIRDLNFTGPIIALTAYDKADVESKAMASGIDKIIEKPFESYQLLNAIYS